MLKFAAMSRLCSSRFERAARKLGWTRIAGLDEAGRGSLFGPVVAAAVILNPKRRIVGLDDSKQLTEKRREEARVIKRYDTAQTPYQRVLADPRSPGKIKTGLARQ